MSPFPDTCVSTVAHARTPCRMKSTWKVETSIGVRDFKSKKSISTSPTESQSTTYFRFGGRVLFLKMIHHHKLGRFFSYFTHGQRIHTWFYSLRFLTILLLLYWWSSKGITFFIIVFFERKKKAFSVEHNNVRNVSAKKIEMKNILIRNNTQKCTDKLLETI